MRTTEPTTITQGERIAWETSFSDYPATHYTLQYRFRGEGQGINVTATDAGTGYAAEITAAQSIDMNAVKYHWQAWLTEIANANNKFIIGEGDITVRAGFTSADTDEVDLRSPAKIMLDTLDAALLSNGDVVEYEITTPAGSRRVKRSTRSEAIGQRKYWAAIVRRENARDRMRAGRPWGTTVKVRMP